MELSRILLWMPKGRWLTVSRPIGGVLCLGSLTVTEVVAIHLCGLPGEIDRTGPPTV